MKTPLPLAQQHQTGGMVELRVSQRASLDALATTLYLPADRGGKAEDLLTDIRRSAG